MKAFPNVSNQQGMDLRDYFAAKAMEIAVKQLERNYTIELGGIEGPDNTWVWEDSDMEEIAEWAYFLADEMMKARTNS
jgi:spore coat protein CotF